ncbi:MAG: NFACT RNA binding domain-containing protein [Candidatus Micrarchaeota archaeon]|nr:NFACT RNA binding domain-containing protein [Candidatus Micrarchaeota archaeon]
MEIELDIRKSVNENAAEYYERAKAMRKKAAGARKAADETRKEMRKAGKEIEKEIEGEKTEKPKLRERRERQWFEKFKWFVSSDGLLCIAGRDAKQNETVVSHYLEENDLFFHADIHGAPATVLKNGKNTPEKTLTEVAQFAASHSSAWKAGAATVDVYAVEKGQVSKHASGGYVGKGAFMISGERKWFRNTPLGLSISRNADGSVSHSPGKGIRVVPGSEEKGKLAKKLAHLLGADVNEVLLALPSGDSSIADEKKVK